MVRIDRLRGDANKRILRCSEGKNIWYRLWMDMMRIEPLLEGGDRIWMYYTFFYEIRNGRRLIGKGRVKEISFYRMNARDVLFSGFFVCCVGYLGMPLIRGVKISWY